MPTDTFYKLTPEKKKRVYDAAIKEFSLVPFEEVSIKNIVNDASIARGSFYQYFQDKEDLFVHIIHTIRRNMEDDMCRDDNLFDYIYSIAEREINAIKLNPNDLPVEARIMSNIAKSAVAQMLFEREIGNKLNSNKRILEKTRETGLHEMDDKALSALLELISQSMKLTIIQVITGDRTAEQALSNLKIKLNILRKGVI